jgi:non-specific protein-tyrosine kinase
MSKLKKALEKAKRTRDFDHQTSVEDRPKYTPPIEPISGDIKECRSELSINYSDTKVKKIDDRVLQKGKVISLFHDLEKVDQIKTLRTQILNKLKEIGGNSLLITSANPYEGKTFTAINLGVSIAQELDRTVLLVDCDLKNHPQPHGELSDLLMNPGIERLVLLPAGRSLPNSSEMLGSPKMEMLVNDIKCRYPEDRVVIFDSSSLLTSADPLVLTRFVDGILLVVEEEKTTTDDLKKVMELLKDKPVIGTVMNKTRSVAN